METKITFSKIVGHTKTILKHKRWVMHWAVKFGIPWQGLWHDMSKFSPTEFWESVRYFQGDSSPINACKADKGFSLAWQHHKGRNLHHYEYWIDKVDDGGYPLLMPYKYAVEMLCDYLAACKVYNENRGKKFSFIDELHWWNEKRKTARIHPSIVSFISKAMTVMAIEGDNNLKPYLFGMYMNSVKDFDKNICSFEK